MQFTQILQDTGKVTAQRDDAALPGLRVFRTQQQGPCLELNITPPHAGQLAPARSRFQERAPQWRLRDAHGGSAAVLRSSTLRLPEARGVPVILLGRSQESRDLLLTERTPHAALMARPIG